MTEPTRHVIDRKGWAPGPWDGEPDKVQWNHAGLACLAVRNHSGNWCGYVGVPNGHPAYGQDYDNVDVDVHGGLTYADRCQVDGPICHVAEPGFPEDVWWLGFDTAHAGDLAPSSSSDYAKGLYPALSEYKVYRDLGYITRETNRLAEQLGSRT